MMSAPGTGGGAGGGVSRSAGRSRDTPADPPFRESDFIREYSAHLDSQQFAAMRMNGDSMFV